MLGLTALPTSPTLRRNAVAVVSVPSVRQRPGHRSFLADTLTVAASGVVRNVPGGPRAEGKRATAALVTAVWALPVCRGGAT